MAKKQIKVRNLDLRDGHQSYFATRMTIEQIKTVLPVLSEVGYYAMEVWGGATLDSCIRFLQEDPWERLDTISKINGKKAHLTALARGINLFGYNPYPEEAINGFNKMAVESGIDIMRVFDALNDTNNLKSTVKAVKSAGGMIDCAISYTTDPSWTFGEKISRLFKGGATKKVFDTDYYVNKSLEMEKMGADMITIKDMAGLLHPKMGYELITKLKSTVKIPIDIHSHTTPGYALTTVVASMMAGVDLIDAVSFPFSGGPSHPAIEILNEFAKKLDIDLGLNEELFPEVRKHLVKVRRELSSYDKYQKYNCVFSGNFTDEQHRYMDKIIELITNKNFDEALKTTHKLEASLGLPEPNEPVRNAQIPGGMYSNLLSQLEQANLSDMLSKVLQEVPKVRLDAGLPPLVTPTSQIVGVQAVRNVVGMTQGKKRYDDTTNQYKNLVKGEYGETPVKINENFREKITGQKEETRFDTSTWKHTEDTENLVKNERDQMLLDLFPTPALMFLRKREENKATLEKMEESNREMEKLNSALSDNYLV